MIKVQSEDIWVKLVMCKRISYVLDRAILNYSPGDIYVFSLTIMRVQNVYLELFGL